MPLFTRRRLQVMLNEVNLLFSSEKVRDLLVRLEDKRVEQVLPAEMELAVLWALSGIGEIDVEPYWWANNSRPDVYTEAFVPGKPAIIEITTPNDNAISGEEAMDVIALQISNFANTIRKNLGRYLYFRFNEKSGYKNGQYFRRRLAPVGYELGEASKLRIRQWIDSGTVEHTVLRIVEDGLDVEIERKNYKQIRYHNFWSSMPSETHSVNENPLYKLLVRKLEQLKGAPPGTLKFIFLGDAGSTLLNRIGSFGEIDPTYCRVSGREILNYFVNTHSTCIDSVVVIAPYREHFAMPSSELRWRVSVFNRLGFSFDKSQLEHLVKRLPVPRFEGYQARSLFRQGMFHPSAPGWSAGFYIQTTNKGIMKVKLSSRALLDFLAGRITAERFKSNLGDKNGRENLFKHWLDLGYTLKSVEIESGGVDIDDDWLVLTFCDDPAARALKLVEKTSNKNDGTRSPL